MKRILKFWLPVIIWMGVIFIFSAIPNLNSGLKEDYILRKIAHALEYAILTFLLFRAISAQGILLRKAIIYSLIIAVFYAFSDEYHQSFIFGRQCSLRDAGIDSIGILIGELVCYIRSRKGRKNTQD